MVVSGKKGNQDTDFFASMGWLVSNRPDAIAVNADSVGSDATD